jgi:outer membrane protein assembly factor BamB
MDGERELYRWLGDTRTVFRIVGKRLYYASYHRSAGGGNVVAADLATGKQIWRVPLKGVPAVSHSFYSNSLNLDANEEVVWVYGNEGAGRYLEFKDVTTGETIGQRIFEGPSPAPPSNSTPSR